MIFKICIVWEYQVFEQIYEETQADIESNDDCNLESGANESSNIALNESSTIEDFPDLRTLNRELNRYLDLTDALQFSNPIENNFGSSDITRFSCTCHKLNVVVRHAISNHELGEILRKLSKSNATVRNSISLNRFFKDHKFRLRLESPTRWGSAFLVLESVKRAYDRGAFSGDLACPISLATIETYIKVLKPAYELSTTLQLKASSTCDVIPSLIHLMTHWETLAVCGAPKELCYRLITNLKSKFRYEFSSPCYRSAPILKIANIKYWMDKTYSKKLISEGLHSLRTVYWPLL